MEGGRIFAAFIVASQISTIPMVYDLVWSLPGAH